MKCCNAANRERFEDEKTARHPVGSAPFQRQMTDERSYLSAGTVTAGLAATVHATGTLCGFACILS